MIGDIMARIIGLTSPGGGLAQVYRYFTTLAPASSKYYEIDNVILAGDFEVNALFTKTAGGIQVLLASDTAGLDFIGWVNSDTILSVKLDGDATISYTTPDVADGKLHALSAIKISGQLEVFMDGVSLGSQASTGTLNVSRISSNNVTPSNFWDGVIADVKIWDGGDSSTGTLVLDSPINENWTAGSTTLINKVGTNGTAINIVQADAELFKLNTSTSPDQWENLDLTRIIPIAGTP